MKLRMCSFRDAKAEAWHTPLFFQSDAQAIRSFGDAVNGREPDNELARHPEDYTLFAVADWDPDTGTVEPLVQPLSLGVGSNFVREIAGRQLSLLPENQR